MKAEFEKAMKEYLSDIDFDHEETVVTKKDLLIMADVAYEWCQGRIQYVQDGYEIGIKELRDKTKQQAKIIEELGGCLEDLSNIENYRPGPKGVTYNLGKEQYATIAKIKQTLAKVKEMEKQYSADSK